MGIQVGFDLVTDNSSFLVGIAEISKAQQDLADETKAFNDQSKAAFKQSADGVEVYTKEIVDSTKSTGKMVNEVNKIGKTKSYVQQLKAEIKQYTSEAAKAGEGTKAWTDNLAKAGKLKDELADLNAAVQSLNGNMGENFARSAGEAVSLVSRGYEGLTALQTLAGTNTEAFEKTLLKLQSLNALANLAKEFGGIGDKITEIKLGMKPLIDLYTKANDALKVFAKEGSEGAEAVGDSNKGIFEKLTGGIKSFVSSGISGIKSLWATIYANPLGVLIAGITALVLLKDKIKPIAQLFEFLGKVLDAALAPLQKIAETLGLIADQSERRAKAVIESTKEEIAALEKRYSYEIAVAEETGKQRAKLEKEKYEMTRNRLNQTLVALETLKKKNQKLDEDQVKAYKETQDELIELDRKRTLDLLKEQQNQHKYVEDFRKIITNANIAGIISDEEREKALVKQNTVERLKAADDALHELSDQNSHAWEELAKAEQAIREQGNIELAAIEKKYADKRAEEAKKLAEKQKALQKDLAEALMDLARKAGEAEAAGLSGEAKIRKETEIANQELAILRATILEKGKLADKNFQFTAEQEDQFNILQRRIFQDQTQKLIQLEADRAAAISQARTAAAQQSINTLTSAENTELLTVDAFVKPEDLSEVEFEETKQKAKLEIQKKYADQQLALQQALFAAQRNELISGYESELQIVGNGEDAETKRKRDEVLERLKLTEDQFIKQQAETQAAYNAQIVGIDTQLAKLNSKKPFSMAKLFGMTEEEFDRMKSVSSALISELQNLTDALYDSKNTELDLETKKNEALIKQRDENIANLEKQISQQKTLSEEGKANSVDSLNQQLAAEKSLREDDLAADKELKIQKAELAKQQLRLDTIMQASNMAVAISTVFETYAAAPYVAAALAVFMVGAFAAQKKAAFDAANANIESAENGYAKGVFNLKGPGSETSDSIPANLSRGETVFTAKKTRENYRLFEGIFNDDKRLMHHGILDLIKGKGISLLPDITESLAMRRDMIRQGETNNYVTSDNSRMERELSDMNARFEALLKEQKQQTYIDSNGNLVKRMGSHQVIIRKR